MENDHDLVRAPLRREGPKQAVAAEREESRAKARALGSHRAEMKKALAERLRLHRAEFPNPSATSSPAKRIVPVERPYTPPQPGRDQGTGR